VLVRLAAVLHVDIQELTGPGNRGNDTPRVYEPAALIEQAMMGYDAIGASIGSPQARINGRIRTGTCL